MTDITKNIIAMGFPSESVEAAYRNPYKEVYRFLEGFHAGHYKVYNLSSERKYDAAKFHNRVACYPFDDHNAPPFEKIETFCKDVQAYIAEDPEHNVAAIHCKAGKGRTGCMICAYMLYTREWETAYEALKFYATIRTYNRKGVTIPSQIRYVHYLDQYLRHTVTLSKRLLLCDRIVLRPKPKLPEGTDYCFHLCVGPTCVHRTKPVTDKVAAERAVALQASDISAASQASQTERQMDILRMEAIEKLKQIILEGGETEDGLENFDFLSAFASRPRDGQSYQGEWGDDPICFDVPSLPLCDDVLLEAYAHGGSQHLFNAWFNTNFVKGNRVRFAKFELDKAVSETKVFAPHFTCEIHFSSASDSKEPEYQAPALAAAASAASSAASATTTTTATEEEAKGSKKKEDEGHDDDDDEEEDEEEEEEEEACAEEAHVEGQIPKVDVVQGAEALHERLFKPIATGSDSTELPPYCSASAPLNVTPRGFGGAEARHPAELSAVLLERLLALCLRSGYLGTVLDEGMAAAAKTQEFMEFHLATAELEAVDLARLQSDGERLAFWLNVYNMLVLHATLLNLRTRVMTKIAYSSPKDYAALLHEARYVVAHTPYSLGDIMLGVLRMGLAPPDFGAAVAAPKWPADDPRRACLVEERDHRVPFALSQCTTSSPRIFVYRPDKIHLTLDRAVAAFFARSTFQPSPKQIYLPRYVQWWAKDFAKKKEHVDTLGQMVQLPALGDMDIKYNEYDWEFRLYLDHLADDMPITHKLPRVPAAASVDELGDLPPQPTGAAPLPPDTAKGDDAKAKKKKHHGKHHHHHQKKQQQQQQ